MRFDGIELSNIASLSEGTYHPAAEEPYVVLLAGRGEVQLNEDGDCWYFRWEVKPDEGPSLVDEQDLGPAPVANLITIADWFAEQAQKNSDR
jgi:hypothetical protein